MDIFNFFQKKFVMQGLIIDETRKRTFLAFGLVVCMPIVCIFAIHDLKNGRIREGVSILIFLIILSGNLFAILHFTNMTKMYRPTGFMIYSFLCYELLTGGGEGQAFLWFYFFPIIAFYLVGKKEGTLWIIITMLLASFILFSPFFHEYPVGTSIRFLVTYGIVSILSFGLEYSRDWYYRELMREKLLLEDTLKEVKTLQGLLPICSFCKRIRDDKGYWNQIEAYLWKYSDAELSHSVCPKCMKEHYPEISPVKP